MQDIFFTSDSHLGHGNIVKGISKWTDTSKCRPFNTQEEHDEHLIDCFNSIVKPQAIVYHLGDFSFGGAANIPKFRSRLHAKTIHLILGNHDHHIYPFDSPFRALFSSVFTRNEFSLKLNSEKTGFYGKQKFFLSHFAHRVWDNSHHGAIHLYGHSHGTLNNEGTDWENARCMDVGVDTNNYYPYHLDEILMIMRNRPALAIDHHNETTN